MKKTVAFLMAIMSLSFVVSAEEIAVTATPAVAPVPEVAAPMAPTIEVVKSSLGSGVDRETRTILGEAASFDTSVEVHYLTRVKAETVPTTITHAYSVDGKEVASVSLAIKGSSWTTWSRKSVWPGAWKVELKDETGNIIETKEFTVTKGIMAPADPVEPAAPPAATPEQPQ
jgi:hypothetical protein